jgi:hypothetical protein
MIGSVPILSRVRVGRTAWTGACANYVLVWPFRTDRRKLPCMPEPDEPKQDKPLVFKDPKEGLRKVREHAKRVREAERERRKREGETQPQNKPWWKVW